MSVAELLAAPTMRSGYPIMMRAGQHATPGHRWNLIRSWGDGEGGPRRILPWIMLNPSTADHSQDDPTLKRIIGFSYRWGFDGLLVVNVFSYRTSKPAELADAVVDWDKRNAWDVRDTCWSNADHVAGLLAPYDAAIAAWGAPAGRLLDETLAWSANLLEEIETRRSTKLELWCIGKTKGGHPVHPLARGKHRIPDGARPLNFEGR